MIESLITFDKFIGGLLSPLIERIPLPVQIIVSVLSFPVVIPIFLLVDHLGGQRITFFYALAFYTPATILILAIGFVPTVLAFATKDMSTLSRIYGHDKIFGFLMLYMQFWGFILICQYIWQTQGINGFPQVPERVNFFTWLLFGIDNILGVVLLDATEIYHITLSGVKYVDTFWISTLIFTYRASLSVGLFATIFMNYKMLKERQVSPNT